MARTRAEIEVRLAEVKQHVEEELARIQALRQDQLAQVNEQVAQLQSQSVEESLRLARESTRRALESAELALQRRGRDVQIISSAWGVHCDDFGWEVLDYADDLGLSDEQIEQIRGMQRDFRRASIQRRADIEVAEMDLETLYDADPLDLTAIRAQLEGVAQMRVDGEIGGLQLRQDVRQILTPEQLDDYEEMREDGEHFRVVVAGAGRLSRVSRFGC